MITEANQALGALDVFNNDALVPHTLTLDELEALRVTIQALKGIAAGQTLPPWRDGDPLTKRQITRVEIRYFIPTAPRANIKPAAEPDLTS